MQVVGINSSPRKKSNTDLLLTSVLKGASDAGCETIHLNLYDFEIEFCIACDSCYKTGKCVQLDEFTDIYEVMMDSDGIVLGSPNYINNVSAKMKTLFDRMADTVHCQRLLGKYVASVSTAGGFGSDEIAEYLNRSLFLMGASVVGSVGANLSDGEESFRKAVHSSYQLGSDLAKAISSKIVYNDQQKEHEDMLERMKQLVNFRKDEWKNEYEYFVQKKWL